MKRLLLKNNLLFKAQRLLRYAPLALLSFSAFILPIEAHAGLLEDAASFFGGGILGAVTSPITVMMWIVFKISSVLLGVAGLIFNWAILVVVFNFATYFGNSQGMLLAWGILRDFGNIILLFGFVFMGIATVLDLHSYPWKKTLPKLVIFAVLLNFSLFISEAVIDATNVVSSTLYQQTYGAASGSGCALGDVNCLVNTGMAGTLMQRLQISDAYRESIDSALAGFTDQFSRPIENILKYVLLSLVTTVVAVVLFAGAFMLISRAVILAFLMVTSPIGFVGMAVPELENMARDWWKKLVDQALFAPVFFILLIASLKMTDGLGQLIGKGSLLDALSLQNVSETSGVLIFFVMTIGFFIGSLMLAQRFGIYGSEAVTQSGMNVIGRVGGLPFGVAGSTARNTLGRASNAAARSIRTNNRIGSIPIVGRTLAGIADRGATASFDIRGKSSALGQASDAAQKGRRGELEERSKRTEEQKKLLDEADKQKYAIASYEAERLKKKIDEKGLGTGTRVFKEYLKQRRKVESTNEYVIEEEKKKKEKFDEKIKEWAEANKQYKDAEAKVEKTDRDLASEEVRKKDIDARITQLQNQEAVHASAKAAAEMAVAAAATSGDAKAEAEATVQRDKAIAALAETTQKLAAERARQTQNSDRIQVLTADKTTYEGERNKALNEQKTLESSINDLGNEITSLRKTIKENDSRYRRNVEGLREGPIASFGVIDREALRSAVMSMKGAEIKFKPADLKKALPKDLQGRITINS